MNKIACLVFTLVFGCCFPARAQWSILNTDPRPTQEAYKYQSFSKTEWENSNFATTAQMAWFNNARYGMFIHFGLSAYVNEDMSWPIVYSRKAPDEGHGAYPDSVWQSWPSKFILGNFNAKEWVKIAREAGMKYIVVIAKHHDGFHMWDTKFSAFKITNTPFGRDYIKEIADACHEAHMPFGLYYSQRDWHHPDYAPVDTSKGVNTKNGLVWAAAHGGLPKAGPTHKKYIEYQKNVIRELCTQYGKIDIFWFDAVWWGGMFNADMWDSENLTRMIRKLQPGIIINNRASIPGDFDTPEQQIGRYQKRPWESALTLKGSWAYSAQPNRSKVELIRNLLSCAQGNGNVLLSWGAHWDGQFDPVQKSLLLSMGQWLKKYGYAYYGTQGGPWRPGNWGGATYKGNKVYLYVYNWFDGKIILPSIPGNSIAKATYVNTAGKVEFKQQGTSWQFQAPATPDSVATLIELTMKNPVAGVLADNHPSTLEGAEYGALLKATAIALTDWKKNQYTLDLGEIKNVTGVGLSKLKNAMSVKISVDGKTWEDITTISPANPEISLTTFLTGANVLGKKLRYIQLGSSKAESLGLKVFAK
jgi:alpha-L-fucosidase